MIQTRSRSLPSSLGAGSLGARCAALVALGLVGCSVGGAPGPSSAVSALTAAPEQPPELGLVRWTRGDFEAAQQRARDLDRPLLVLFQEVPG